MVSNNYCPIFRVGDVVRYAQQNFTKLADKVICYALKMNVTNISNKNINNTV